MCHLYRKKKKENSCPVVGIFSAWPVPSDAQGKGDAGRSKAEDTIGGWEGDFRKRQMRGCGVQQMQRISFHGSC